MGMGAGSHGQGLAVRLRLERWRTHDSRIMLAKLFPGEQRVMPQSAMVGLLRRMVSADAFWEGRTMARVFGTNGSEIIDAADGVTSSAT
jgi:hypothetical protein